MNPGELRKYAKRYEWADGDISEWLFAAADAWEASLRDLRDSSEQIVLDNETIASLQRRLAEAETALRNIGEDDGVPTSVRLEALAALAPDK